MTNPCPKCGAQRYPHKCICLECGNIAFPDDGLPVVGSWTTAIAAYKQGMEHGLDPLTAFFAAPFPGATDEARTRQQAREPGVN